ncbi:MAG: glycosyltransferase [Saprospiraceae bacterium]|nr:glycosyltransferase [Saprospiraceae bacterium]
MEAVFFILKLVYLISSLLIVFYCAMVFNLLIQFLWRRKRKAPKQSAQRKEWPFISIQLPVFNEQFVVSRLIDAIARLDYPREKFEIQILDDSTDDTLNISRERSDFYRARGYNTTVLHRTDRTGYKAGALKYGLEKTQGEFICIFDADFIPDPNFLKAIIPYFSDDQVGVVQARWGHTNDGENLLTALQAIQLNVHFTIEQGGRYEAGYPLQFNGTAGIWRKTAILDAGGWEEDTLTEDLDLSYRAQLRGWKVVFLPEVIAPAELPNEVGGLKSQQYRWMKGGAETARKLLPRFWKAPIGFISKMQATGHLLSSSVYAGVFVTSILSLPLSHMDKTAPLHWFGFIAFIPTLIMVYLVYLFGNVNYLLPGKKFLKEFAGFHLRFPIFLCLSMGLSLHNSLAVVSGWLGRKSPFVRTPKKSDQANGPTTIYTVKPLPLITWLEGLLALYFLMGITSSIYNQKYAFLLFQIMCFIGYLTIFTLSLKSIYHSHVHK